MIKKITLLFFIFIFCTTLPSFAAETFEYDKISYSIDLVTTDDSDEASISLTAISYTTDVATSIPKTIIASVIYDLLGYTDDLKNPTALSKALGELGEAPITVEKSKNLAAQQSSNKGSGHTNEDGIFIPDDLESISKEPEEPVETKKPDDSIKVILHGICSMTDTQVIFPDQKPVIVEGRTLVPARSVFEQMGYTVEWDAATSMVTVGGAEKSLLIPVGQPFLRIDGKDYAVDVPAQLIGGRTMIPLRAISWALGMQVDWDAKGKTVNIYYVSAPFDK